MSPRLLQPSAPAAAELLPLEAAEVGRLVHWILHYLCVWLTRAGSAAVAVVVAAVAARRSSRLPRRAVLASCAAAAASLGWSPILATSVVTKLVPVATVGTALTYAILVLIIVN